jgi:hypothetical protein
MSSLNPVFTVETRCRGGDPPSEVNTSRPERLHQMLQQVKIPDPEQVAFQIS